MSYYMMHGLGAALRGFGRAFGGSEECTTGEVWDSASETCLCAAGLVPSPVVGGGCVPVKTGGTTGDSCLMKGMDYDIASQSCIPRCPPGYGHDTAGNCVSKAVYDREHGLTPGGGAGPAPGEGTDAIAKASMPWLIGAAVGVGALALFAVTAGKKKRETDPYRPNRRHR